MYQLIIYIYKKHKYIFLIGVLAYLFLLESFVVTIYKKFIDDNKCYLFFITWVLSW